MYRERIEKLSGWLEDQVVSGHVFEKMKEIRNRRITDAMILRPIKDDNLDKDNYEQKKNVKGLGEGEELGAMEIYLNQDAERRARQLIQRSGVVPASRDIFDRQGSRLDQIANADYNKLNKNIKKNEVIETWLSSGMMPGDNQIDLPKEYNEWKMQKMVENLAPDLRLRKKLLENSLNKIKPIPVNGEDLPEDMVDDENVLQKNFETSVMFAPPLVMPEIKVKSPKRMVHSRGRSPVKHISPRKIGIDMKEIAKVVVKQVQDTLEATIENSQIEIEDKIDSLNDYLKQLEDKTNLILEKSEQNSPKLEIIKSGSLREKLEIAPKKQNLSLLTPIKKMESPIPPKKTTVVSNVAKPKTSVNEEHEQSHEKVSVKFSQYFSMFKKKMLKSFNNINELYLEMKPDSNGDITQHNFTKFLINNKIPGGNAEHVKLFDQLKSQSGLITRLSLFKNMHPLYENPDPTLEDFVKLLDEIYEGCEIPVLVSTFKDTFLNRKTFVKFGQDQLLLSELSMDYIWKNYMCSGGVTIFNTSEKLIEKIMSIRKDLGLEDLSIEKEKQNINDNIAKKEKEREEEEERERIRKEKEREEEEERERIRKEKEINKKTPSITSISSASSEKSKSAHSSISSSSSSSNKESKNVSSNPSKENLSEIKVNTSINRRNSSNSNFSESNRNSIIGSSDSEIESKHKLKSESKNKSNSGSNSENTIESDSNSSSKYISRSESSSKSISKSGSESDLSTPKSKRKQRSSSCSESEMKLNRSLSSSNSMSELDSQTQEDLAAIEKDPTKRAIIMNLNPETESLPLEDRLRSRIKEVYKTGGIAYKEMCGGKIGTKNATLSEFGDFIEKLNIFLSFSESKEFYGKITKSQGGSLTIGSMYSYLHKLEVVKNADPEIIGVHLKEIYGTIEEAFKKKDLFDHETITEEEFINVCIDSGYSKTALKSLFKEMTGNIDGAYVEVQDVIQCLQGHMTAKEVYEDELNRNSQWAIWRVVPQRKIPINEDKRKSELNIVIQALTSEKIKEFKGIGREELINIVENFFMREQLSASSQVIAKDEKGYSLSVIVSGAVDSIESLWYGENILETFKVGDIIGIEMFKSNPSKQFLRTNEETVLWKLSPKIWEIKVKNKVNELKDGFLAIDDYFKQDKVFSKLDLNSQKKLYDNAIFTRYPSKTCIFKQGELAKSFILIFEGSISLIVDEDLTKIPENYRKKSSGTSIGDKYLINRMKYPYSCYCDSECESVIIITISDDIINSVLNDEIKQELIKMDEKLEKKNPIPIQEKLRYPDLKLIPKVGVNKNLKDKKKGINNNIRDDSKEEEKKEDNNNDNDDNNKNDNDSDSDNELSESEKKISLEYLKADIQSRILRKHMSLAECFNYMYEKCVSKVNKEKMKNIPPITLFDEESQPDKDLIVKWPKYDKLFIGNWIDNDAFAEYVSEILHIKATFTDITSIFMNFSSPLDDRLYIGTFYRNFEKISELSMKDFNRRLVEIDGSVFNTFTKVGGVVPGGSVSTDTFIVIGGRAGFTRPEATELFLKQIDVLKTKTVSLTTLSKLVSGEISKKEAHEQESGYGLFSMAQDYFGGGGGSVSRLCDSDGILDYKKLTTKYEDVSCKKEKELKILDNQENNRLLSNLDNIEPLTVLNSNQRIWLLSLLERKQVKQGSKFINQGDPNAPIVILYRGELSVMQTGFFGYDSQLEEITVKSEKDDIKLYGWREYYSLKKASEVSLVAKNDSIIYLLSRNNIDQIIEMINDRVEKIKNIYLVLLKTPNIRDWPINVLEKFACCLRIEIFMDNDIILEMGPCDIENLRFYIVADGEVMIEGVPMGDMEELSDYTIGRSRYFGEWAIIKGFDERTSNVISKGKKTALLSIPKRDFKRILLLIGDYAIHRFQDYGLQLYHFSPKHSKRFNSPIRVLKDKS
ncbi:cyclic nucleotide-binding domain-containing [Cryptosporidium sp. chipmunk genotype I]|uniref:cyclic nucleotide-binding domain-containing n=1 Tax=Cryptosporidium sp. chipmunk genotype I TaxID=1280935 RepID=UPI003519F9E3|nr:cyclic nucleotide-binding domain-containing [Cryptosporidium sp. chipmunk genotype I]